MTLETELQRLRETHLFRERLVLESPQGVEIRVEGQRLLSFCSNDYLGLASDPRVVAALKAGAERYGVGAGASHLITGHSAAHRALEEELADFVGAPRVLLFSTGYMANLGVVTALADRRTTILEDRLNHASLIDAARLARVEVKRYPHRDTARLRSLLIEAPGPVLITTDAVFSMDGDLAPLRELLALGRDYGARVVVDDAHGLGVLGRTGRGSFEHFALPLVPPAVLMATLGKALGVFGAFVAGEEALVESLVQRARTYIYTTALPAAMAEAARESLRIVRAEPWRRERLHALVRRFRDGARRLGFRLPQSDTPIQPLVLGSAEKALAASRALRTAGILVPAIRPPTVPKGSARLRFTFCAAHDEAHIDRLLEALSVLSRHAPETFDD